MEEVFCKNREEPLKIGSVKTNIGHAEPVSALMSLIKIIVAMETGIIPAHLNYDEPNVNIPALKNKSIEVGKYLIIPFQVLLSINILLNHFINQYI